MCRGKKVKDFTYFPVLKIWNSHSQWFSTCQGQFGTIWRNFWSLPLGGEGGHPGLWWVGTRDAAKGAGWPHTAENDLASNTNSEKPRSRCNGNSKGLTGLWILEKEGGFYEAFAHGTPLSLKDTWRLTYPPSFKSMKRKKNDLEFFVQF